MQAQLDVLELAGIEFNHFVASCLPLNSLEGSSFDNFFLYEADCVGKLLSGQREVCNKKQRSEEKEY
jgi:hypothetical protein